MSTDAGEEAIAKADRANQHYEVCLKELQKWKADDPGPLESDEDWAAFSRDMRSTVAALDKVIGAAGAARAAEERAIRANFKFGEQRKRIRESRQVWDDVIKRYSADRGIIVMLTPSDKVPGSVVDSSKKASHIERALSEPKTLSYSDPLAPQATQSKAINDVKKTLRRPNETECTFCAYSPVAVVTLRREVGMVIMRRRYRFSGRYCKNCGIALFRETQNATLMSGWWGFISAPVNLSSVISNARESRKLRRLSEPKEPKEPVAVLRQGPADLGKPLIRKSGIWITALFVAVVAVGIHSAVESSGNAPQSSGGGNIQLPLFYEVGSCVTASGHDVTGVVSCSQTHFAEIVAIEARATECPFDTTQTVTEHANDLQPGMIVCIDDEK
jgi:hypothetical protein